MDLHGEGSATVGLVILLIKTTKPMALNDCVKSVDILSGFHYDGILDSLQE